MESLKKILGSIVAVLVGAGFAMAANQFGVDSTFGMVLAVPAGLLMIGGFFYFFKVIKDTFG